MLEMGLPDGVDLRLLERADAELLLDAYVRNREHLAPWDPARTDAFFTLPSMAARVDGLLGRLEAGLTFPWLLVRDSEIVGTITLDGVVRGASSSAGLGYWVGAEFQGRGIATSAVAAVCSTARTDLHLHRIHTATLPHNERSQKVLLNNEFERIGFAPSYLHIAGRWRDHVLYQRVLSDEPPEYGAESSGSRPGRL